jgi:carbamoyl-phosphate synthase/aspartate carbamoyltransferase/dihydroorotase
MGMVDPHAHLRDLGWSHKATFASETAAALAGGYWAVFDMPNTPPSTVSRSALDRKLTEIGQKAVCDWGIYFGASQADNTREYSLVADDTCGLKIYNNATTGDLLLDDQTQRERHFAAWPATRVIAVHAEDETVPEILELVRRYRKPTHFVHISTAKEIDYLRAAKAQGLPVTVGVCPHHLYLTERDEGTLGALGRMKPGLKTAADRDALWAAIGDGLVDVVESDHAPHTLAEKASANAPYGVPGLETTLPLLLLAVNEGRLTLERVVELVALNPRRIWGLECPPGTYALVDLDAEYVIARENLHTQCGWSPFEGMRVRGKVIETWIRGRKVYDGERVLVAPGSGRNLFGKPT